ncbi:hypothetical protein [Phenylobacterium sp.]|uniref:hypothetical protein n=1 Tax=Phenylobacterium sp. TaxID=1871053 RepID=UPI0035B48FFF
MIDDRLGAFIESSVMMVVASRGVDGRAALARGLGARREPDGRLGVVTSETQWPRAVTHLAPGAAVAFTVCRPTDYVTYQIKGELADIAPADAADRDMAGRYVERMTGVLMGLGVGPRQIACWLTSEGLLRLTLSPRMVFQQTPGPSAGEPMGAGR